MHSSVRILKRAIDVAGSLAGLAIAAPMLPLAAVIIAMDSKGPIFYRQRRAGKLCRPHESEGESAPTFVEFDMFKLRTMYVDAERLTGPILARENDPRVTRVGRFLRRTRLDEVPQLWNVLKGDMSLVGPRPERPELAINLALAIPFFEERMRDVKPGITGLAQVSLGYSGRPLEGSAVADHQWALTNPFELEDAEGAEADDMRIKLLFDLAYAAAHERLGSFLPLELSILVKTPWIMMRGIGR